MKLSIIILYGCLPYSKGSDVWPEKYLRSTNNQVWNLIGKRCKTARCLDYLKKLKEEKGNVPKNVTNALFVGSTTELQKLIKKNKDKK